MLAVVAHGTLLALGLVLPRGPWNVSLLDPQAILDRVAVIGRTTL